MSEARESSHLLTSRQVQSFGFGSSLSFVPSLSGAWTQEGNESSQRRGVHVGAFLLMHRRCSQREADGF